MIYLLGVYHNVQAEFNNSLSSIYCSFLKQKVKKLHITCIAEEYSKFACQQKNIQESTTKKLCRTLGIKHKYCDPDDKQRLRLGLPNSEEREKEINIEFRRLFNINKNSPTATMNLARNNIHKKYSPIREEYWLSKIKVIKGNIIFVCGSGHLKSFFGLLKSRKYEVEVFKQQFIGK